MSTPEEMMRLLATSAQMSKETHNNGWEDDARWYEERAGKSEIGIHGVTMHADWDGYDRERHEAVFGEMKRNPVAPVRTGLYVRGETLGTYADVDEVIVGELVTTIDRTRDEKRYFIDVDGKLYNVVLPVEEVDDDEEEVSKHPGHPDQLVHNPHRKKGKKFLKAPKSAGKGGNKKNHGRAGGDKRGSSYARAARKRRMLADYGNGKSCRCIHCDVNLFFETLEADKIDDNDSYTDDNILPSCRGCNNVRGTDQEWMYEGRGRRTKWATRVGNQTVNTRAEAEREVKRNRAGKKDV